MTEDSISEFVEFLLVNFTWGLGVDLFAGGLNPFPFFLSDGVVHFFGKFLKSYLDLFVGEGSVVVGIEVSETFSSHIVVNAFVLTLLLIVFFDISITFSSKMAETEVLEDSVSELIEFFLVNFTFVMGVDLITGGLNPFPLFLGDDVVLGFSELLKSYLDLFVGEGSIVVGIEGSETISSKFVVNALILSSFSSFSSVLSSDISIIFSSKITETEVLEDSVSEFVEFFLVNFTWGLGVDLFAGGFNPCPFGFSDGVVHGTSEFLKSYLDLFVG